MINRTLNWHTLEPNAVASVLGVNPKTGLTTADVSERQLRYGRNLLQKIKSRPAWRLLIDQFTSIVIALLAVAAAIAWATDDTAEAIAILVVLVLNAGVGFATEWKAGRALDALRRQSRTSERVRRNSFETTVDAEELVPSDIVILNAGNRVPADARLLEALRLEAEESALTGESTTVEKPLGQFQRRRRWRNVARCFTSAPPSHPAELWLSLLYRHRHSAGEDRPACCDLHQRTLAAGTTAHSLRPPSGVSRSYRRPGCDAYRMAAWRWALDDG